MAVHIFKENSTKLTEHSISDAYAMYLHTFVDSCSDYFLTSATNECAIMTYDEFKEFYILKVLGRSSEFTQNIARDYQFLSMENQPQMPL